MFRHYLYASKDSPLIGSVTASVGTVSSSHYCGLFAACRYDRSSLQKPLP